MRKRRACLTGTGRVSAFSARRLRALVVVTELDVFGVERYQSDVDEIGYATVFGWGGYNETRIIQPENIEALLSLQKDIIANKKLTKIRTESTPSPLRIDYYGTDGKLPRAPRVYLCRG